MLFRSLEVVGGIRSAGDVFISGDLNVSGNIGSTTSLENIRVLSKCNSTPITNIIQGDLEDTYINFEKKYISCAPGTQNEIWAGYGLDQTQEITGNVIHIKNSSSVSKKVRAPSVRKNIKTNSSPPTYVNILILLPDESVTLVYDDTIENLDPQAVMFYPNGVWTQY